MGGLAIRSIGHLAYVYLGHGLSQYKLLICVHEIGNSFCVYWRQGSGSGGDSGVLIVLAPEGWCCKHDEGYWGMRFSLGRIFESGEQGEVVNAFGKILDGVCFFVGMDRFLGLGTV